MRCYIDKSKCKKSIEGCSDECRAYILFEAIYSKTNIPKKYIYEKALVPSEIDLDKYRLLNSFKNNIVKNVDDGKCLYIHSKYTGNGKTSWACKIAGEFIKKKIFSKDIENLVFYVNVPEFLEELRCGYENGEYEKIIKNIKKARIVIFDDLGAERGTDWVRERLYTIINFRIVEEKMNIYTSNISVDEVEMILGSRIGSRVRSSEVVEFLGKDRRGINNV